MGITQQKKGVATIKEIINLLLLRGNIGKPGAGASPIRGHSNVQGDRTMGIWEQMPQSFMDSLGEEFGFEPPREHGVDAVETINKMRDGGIQAFVALGGNFVGAISDTNAAEAAMQNTELSVQISTKLNRSHTVTGAEALILPTMGRSEIDIQESGPQFVSVEDTVCAVHPSWGSVEPVSHHLLSEPAIVSRLGKALVGDKVKADWDGFEKNYDLIRDHISRVVGGCENYNERIRQEGGFILANGPRDSRTFPTPTGKAVLTVNDLEHVERPEGTLILQSMRSHDQFNTTIYGHNDRYRGIKKGRHVVFVNPEDIAELGLADGHVRGHPRRVPGRRGADGPQVPGGLLPHRPRLRGRLLPGGQRAGAPEPHGRGQQHAGLQGRDCEARTQRGPDPGRLGCRGIRRGQDAVGTRPRDTRRTGHAQSWPRPLDIMPTCPFQAAATGHNAYMSIPARQGRACPTGFARRSTGHAQSWPRPLDIMPHVHSSAPREGMSHGFARRSTGHAQSWPRPLDIMPTCPFQRAKGGHVPRGGARVQLNARAIGPAWPSPFRQGRRIRRARTARGPCSTPRGRHPACSSGPRSTRFPRRSRR